MNVLTQNPGDIFVLIVTAAVMALCLRSLILNLRSGGCGYGKCSECGHGCDWVRTKEFLKNRKPGTEN